MYIRSVITPVTQCALFTNAHKSIEATAQSDPCGDNGRNETSFYLNSGLILQSGKFVCFWCQNYTRNILSKYQSLNFKQKLLQSDCPGKVGPLPEGFVFSEMSQKLSSRHSWMKDEGPSLGNNWLSASQLLSYNFLTVKTYLKRQS
jgi:hypothetical protein